MRSSIILERSSSVPAPKFVDRPAVQINWSPMIALAKVDFGSSVSASHPRISSKKLTSQPGNVTTWAICLGLRDDQSMNGQPSIVITHKRQNYKQQIIDQTMLQSDVNRIVPNYYTNANLGDPLYDSSSCFRFLPVSGAMVSSALLITAVASLESRSKTW